MSTQHPPGGAPAPAFAWPLVLGLILALALWRLWAAARLPVTQDEAYYFDWARRLAWGYFDHPPGVAPFGIGVRFAPGSALAGRLGGLLAGALTLWVLARFYFNAGLVRRDDLGLALVLAAATLAGLVGGVLTTPDTPLALAWALALHEGERALAADRRRWLTAGIAVGLGLLGKYTMVLIGPIFLWAILRTDPRALRTPWPYLGGLLALLVFGPNLIWNAQHDWLTFRFQLGHGLPLDTGGLALGGGTLFPTDDPLETFTWTERLGSLANYLAGQLALWGLLALPLLALLIQGRRRPAGPAGVPGRASPLTRRAGPLLRAATLFPLGFFALAALGREPEPNWPAMYLLAAPALLAVPLAGLRRWVWGAAGANLVLASLYIVQGATAALPLPDATNRVLRETHGFQDLATLAAGLDAPVYAERYQLTAMLNFYRPGLGVTQWPGLARPSEYLVGQIAPRADPRALTGPFWLVSREPSPPPIPGFRPTAQRTLYDCAGTRLTEGDRPPCPSPLHQWSVYRYE